MFIKLLKATGNGLIWLFNRERYYYSRASLEVKNRFNKAATTDGFLYVTKEVSEMAKNEVKQAADTLSDHVFYAFRLFGTTVILDRTLMDMAPSLGKIKARGCDDDGATWANSEGGYEDSTNRVHLAELYKTTTAANDNSLEKDLNTPGVYEESDRLSGAIAHELGHAMHSLLKNKKRIIKKSPALLRKLKRAYKKDAARLSPDDREDLSYYLQKGDTGLSEAFAELWGQHQINGEASDCDMRHLWPQTMPVIKAIDTHVMALFAQATEAEKTALIGKHSAISAANPQSSSKHSVPVPE